MKWIPARQWAPLLAFALALASMPALAQNTSSSGGNLTGNPTLTADPTYVNLSLYDCIHNGATQVTFSWEEAWTSTQVVEYDLSTNSSCTPPTNTILGGTATTDDSDTTAKVEGINPRVEPSDGMTTEAGGLDDTSTNLTFAGIWDYENQSTTVGDVQLEYNSMPTSADCPTDVSTILYLCVNLYDSATTTTGSTAGITSGWVTFVMQSAPPDSPANVAATPLDSGISVSWDSVTTPEDAYGYIAYAQDPTSGDIVNSASTTGGTSVTIDRLIDGVTYNVYVVSLDNAGSNPPTTANQSPPSNVVVVTPVASIGFFEQYKLDNGKENGCSNAGGASLLLLLPLLILLRRKRSSARLARPVAIAAAVAIFSSAGIARAEGEVKEEDAPADAPVTHHFSPEYFRVDLMTGIYSPNPDSEPGLSGTPYAQIFSQKGLPFMTKAQFHVNFWGGLGHLSIGISAGVWAVYGHSLLLNHTTQSGDEEVLTLYPFAPLLGYRLDFIYTKFGVPVVPYVKVGYGVVYFLDTKNGNATEGTYNGQTWHSYGFAGGPEGAGGIEFPLDFLDPRRAANLDEDFGINSTGLFVEAGYDYWLGLNGGLRLNSGNYSAGLYVAF